MNTSIFVTSANTSVMWFSIVIKVYASFSSTYIFITASGISSLLCFVNVFHALSSSYGRQPCRPNGPRIENIDDPLYQEAIGRDLWRLLDHKTTRVAEWRSSLTGPLTQIDASSVCIWQLNAGDQSPILNLYWQGPRRGAHSLPSWTLWPAGSSVTSWAAFQSCLSRNGGFLNLLWQNCSYL